MGKEKSRNWVSGQKDRENTWKRKFHLKTNKNFVSKSSTLRANALLSEKKPKSFKSEAELNGNWVTISALGELYLESIK